MTFRKIFTSKSKEEKKRTKVGHMISLLDKGRSQIYMEMKRKNISHGFESSLWVSYKKHFDNLMNLLHEDPYLYYPILESLRVRVNAAFRIDIGDGGQLKAQFELKMRRIKEFKTYFDLDSYPDLADGGCIEECCPGVVCRCKVSICKRHAFRTKSNKCSCITKCCKRVLYVTKANQLLSPLKRVREDECEDENEDSADSLLGELGLNIMVPDTVGDNSTRTETPVIIESNNNEENEQPVLERKPSFLSRLSFSRSKSGSSSKTITTPSTKRGFFSSSKKTVSTIEEPTKKRMFGTSVVRN